MADIQRYNREKLNIARILADFMVWIQVQGERTPELMDKTEDEIVDEYLNSNWYAIHIEVENE